jgi:tetratricopeptide (TPR) repeat protein
MYPGDYSNWINLADAYSAVGRFADAEFIGQRAVAMSETGVDAYVNLAVAQIRQGRFSAAQTTCNLAIKRGFDAAIIHALLREIALVTGNRAEQNREQAWLASRPPSVDALNDEANIDYQAGHIVLGDATMVRLAAVLKAMGGKPVAHAVPAIDRFEIGMTDAARSWLKGKIWSDDDTDYIFALAEFGDAVQAKRLLAKQLRASPQNTIYVLDLTPSVNAALALRHHDAQAAIRALAPGFSFAWNQAERTYLLGKAYTEAGDMPHAQAAFQAIVDHPGWDPVSITLPLAQLGLARALTREGKLGAARLAYQAFLDRWHNADPDIPLLINARTEFARLGGRA